MEVTMAQILLARENRMARQAALGERHGLPVISFSMNIPGPLKDSPLIRRGFYEGCSMLESSLPEKTVRERELILEATGCEAVYAVELDAIAIKKLTVALED